MEANQFNPLAFPPNPGSQEQGMTQFEWFVGQALAGGQTPGDAIDYAKRALQDCALVDKSFKNEIDQIS